MSNSKVKISDLYVNWLRFYNFYNVKCIRRVATVREKSRKFAISHGNSKFLVKVSEKSGNSILLLQLLRATLHEKLHRVSGLINISNTRKSVSSGFTNTEK